MVEEGRETIPDGGQPSEEGQAAALDAVPAQGNLLKDLLQSVAENLVTKPDAVEVTESEGENASVLELRVDQDDLGRIIGKQGRTAKSLRTILNAAASRSNRKVTVEIVED
jgi:predicted RNA-binding protein YlqC (UPF0109 family)